MLTAAASTLSNNSGGSYSNDRPLGASGDAELGTDPASGGFFHSDYKKHEDLKQMLDSNKDGLKLEAMKRIIGMVAKGRDASDLFPAVVKNVVSKNIEVKKLVYVYLVRYAEDQQDLALLSISTFQRALKDPNQLIRASALRVLSSIRVSMIVPIVMLAIKDSASDMSPYVRKTAAHAIPKLYSLDSEQKDELISVLEKLLSDKTTLVVGSAVMAFEEVCPERIDLIHKNYRKLCNLLVDVDEWGQVVIVNMLTRYARTQFINPNLDDIEEDENRPFYDSDSDSSNVKKIKFSLDGDHRLLLRNTKPLLQSRNASVVMAVAQLYHHVAPRSEVMIAAKALIRLLRNHREVQSIVLNCIASISIARKGMFEPFLKSFFVRTSDPTHIKLLKLDILTNLATETSISVILREFQTYISSSDKEFVGASIQAIGRCASNIKEVTDTCLNGLVSLLSNRDEVVVAESVVVIKKLLQTQPNEHKEIIAHMAKLMDFITVPQARASILWLLGEYSDRVPKIAPDVLRKMAKSFINEKDIVKLQILNLAVKLCLNNPEQTKLFCQYVFQLAKYDQNYDIRDRARFLRYFIFDNNNDDDDDNDNTNNDDNNGEKKLAKYAKNIFFASKPAPTLMSRFKGSQYQLGTLSHYLDMPCAGYRPLPDFPEVAPDPSVRDVAEPIDVTHPPREKRHNKKDKKVKEKSFYSEDDSSPNDQESQDESSDTSSSETSNSDDSSSSVYSSESNKSKEPIKKIINNVESETSDSESDSDESSSESGSSDSSNDNKLKKKITENKKEKIVEPKPKSNLDLLLDLDDVIPMTPVMTPSLGGFLTPINPISSINVIVNGITQVSPFFTPTKRTELVNKITGRGLKIESRFTRCQHLVNPMLASVELAFINEGNQPITNIQIGNKNLPSGMMIHDFSPITILQPNVTLSSIIGINYNDSTQPANFNIEYTIGDKTHAPSVQLKPTIGEIIRAVQLPENMFIVEKDKLKGMNEHTAKLIFNGNKKELSQKIIEAANLAIVSNENDFMRFAGNTLSSKSLVLVTVKFLQDQQIEIIVNCEKMVIGSMLLSEIKGYFH
ncbi:GSCOCG00007677001-RA-CDS [Cotesia congregata]|uniref:AP-3 complex subunit beta n=1 Tax=Cotesia congregata TaxID=51543 RepID=A0A8J2MSC2_COTCN|nr:GSCOCG00007677001-RA-CDS [Cotesia congregata]CAG5099395.1 Similar to AP3B2: AP-3 complex subunit beta-2 (Homo sapiens) [Cotesia congregata]